MATTEQSIGSLLSSTSILSQPPQPPSKVTEISYRRLSTNSSLNSALNSKSSAERCPLLYSTTDTGVSIFSQSQLPPSPLKSTILELPSNINSNNCNQHLSSFNEDEQTKLTKQDANPNSTQLFPLNHQLLPKFVPVSSVWPTFRRATSAALCSKLPVNLTRAVHGCHAHQSPTSSQQPHQLHSQSQTQCSNMSKYSVGSSNIGHCNNHSLYPSSSASSGASSPCPSSLPPGKSSGSVGGGVRSNLGAKISYYSHNSPNHQHGNYQHHHQPGTVRTNNKPHYFQHHHNHPNHQHHHSHNQHQSSSQQSNSCFSSHYPNQFEYGLKSFSSSSCNSPVHHQQTVLLSPGGTVASPVHHINRQSIKNYNHNNSGGPGAPSATVIGSNCTTPTKSLGLNTGNKPDILLDRKAFINLEKSINWKLLLNSSISTAAASATTTTATLVATSGATNEMSTTPATTTTTTSTTIHDHHNHSKKPRQTIKSSLQPNFANSNNANANNEAQHQLHSHHHHQQQQQQPHPQQQASNLDFTLPGMKDVPSWLKLLRLHKYASFFARMSYEEMLNLTETDLEHQNITKGARQKLILSIQKLKARSAVLLVSECNFLNCSDNFRTHRTNSSSSTCTGATGYNTTISYNTLSHVLFQIRAFLSTPIRPSSSLVSAPVIATGKSSEIGSNQMVVSNYSVVNDYCTIVSPPQTALVITALPSLSPGASNHCLPGESLMSTSVDVVPSEYALSPTSSSSSSSSSSSASSVDVNNNSSQHHNYQANSLVIRTGNSTLSSRHTDSSSRWPQLHQLSTSTVKTDCQDGSLIDNVPVDHQQLLQCWSTLCNDQLSDIMTRLIGHVHHILVSKCKKRLKKLKLWQYFFKDIYDKLLILNTGAKRNEIGELDQYDMSNIEQIHRKGGNVSEQSPTLVISTSQTSSNDSDHEDEDEEDSALVDCDMNDGSSSLADKDSHTTSDSSNSSTPKTFQHSCGNGSADKDSGVDEAAGDSDNSSDSEILKVEHEEELYSMMRTVLDKCLSHEAFQQYSILFVHWREQLQLMINSLHYIVNDSLLISSLSPPLAPIGVTGSGYCDLGHSNGYHQNHHHHHNNNNLTNYSSSQSSQYSNFHSSIHHRNHQQSQQHSSNSFQSVSHKSMSPTNEGSGKTPLLQISKNIVTTSLLAPASAAGALSSSKTSSICAGSCSASLSLSSSSLSSTSSLFLSNSSSSSSTSLSSLSNLQPHHYHYQNNPNQSNRRLLQLKQLYSGQPHLHETTTTTINDNHHNNNNNRFNDKHPKLASNFNNNNNKDFSINQHNQSNNTASNQLPQKQSHHYKQHRYNTSNLSVISSASSQPQVSDTPVASNSMVTNNNNIPSQNSGNLANSASSAVSSSTAPSSSASIFLNNNNNNNNSSPELNFRKLLLQQLINNQHQVQTQPATNCSNTTTGNTGGHYCSQNSNNINQELSSSSMLTSESLPFNSFNTSGYDANQQIQQFKTVDSDQTAETLTQDSMLDNEFNFSSIDFDDCRKQWNLLSDDVGNSDDKNINGLYRFADQCDKQQIIDQNNCWSNGPAYFDSKLEDSAVEFNGTSITGSCNLTKFSEFNVSATTGTCTDNHSKMTFDQNHERNSDNLLFPDLNPALSSLTTVGTLTRNDQQHPNQSVQHRSNRIGQNVAGGDCNGGVNRDVDCDDQHLKNNSPQPQQQQVANSTSTFINNNNNNNNNSITTDLDDIEQLCIRMAEHALEI